MSTQPLPGSHSNSKTGFAAARTALAAFTVFAVLALPGHSLWAQTEAQAEISAFLPAGKTLLTAKDTALAQAVATAIVTNADVSLTAADIAAAAFQPLGGKVRSDRETSAAVVTGSADNVFLLSSTDTIGSIETNVAAITDAVATVNSGTTAEELTVSGQTAVVKASIAAISDDSVTLNSVTLLPVDESIGAKLVADATLEALPKDGLTTLLQKAIVGITGAKGHSTGPAPQAAADFVAGLVSISGTVPDQAQAANYNTFAVAILKDVSKNTSVDELVANAIGNADDATTGDLENLATALYLKYSTAIAKITQGITAVIPKGLDTEVNRVALIEGIVSTASKDVAAIDQGASFTDPNYAYAFTNGSFSELLTTGGIALAEKDAAAIATDEGNVLGQDGNQLVLVGGVFADLTGSNPILASKAATYLGDLISGAAKSKVPASQFTGAAANLGGGTLMPIVGNGKNTTILPTVTVDDLAALADEFTNAIIAAVGTSTPAEITTDGKDISAIAKAALKLAKDDQFAAAGNQSNIDDSVAALIAGTLADDIAAFNLGATDNATLVAAIEKAVSSAAPGKTSNDTLIKTLVTTAGGIGITGTNQTEFTTAFGDITVSETTVTNL